MKLCRTLAGFFSLAMVAMAATPVRPITHEDLWTMKRVGAPQPSPDGRMIVFPVTEGAYDAKEQVSDLWLAPVDGGVAPRKLTQTKGIETSPRWSPDGTRIAFSARRDGDEVAQIYVIDVARGGEAGRITSLTTGARSPRWSPDGRTLLFVSEVYPGADDEAANRQAAKAEKDRKHTARVYDGFPIRNWDRWLDAKKAHLFVQEAVPGAKPRDLLAGTALAGRRGFAGRMTDSGEEFPAVWTPDGRGVVFIASTTRDRAAFEQVPTQLFLVGLDGGEPRQLTNDQDSYASPNFLRDGSMLVCEMTKGVKGTVYHHARLAAFPWPFDAGRRAVLTSSLDLKVGTFAIGADDRTVYFTAEIAGTEKLYSVPVGGGVVRAYDIPRHGALSNLAGEGAALVANHDSVSSPNEIVRLDPAAGTMRPLTRFNAELLARLDLSPAEHFTFKSSKGRSIHNLLIRPAGFDPAKKYPLIALIHGGPHSQWRDAWSLRWNCHLLAAPGYVLLLTNYTGSTGSTEAFAQAIQRDPLKTPGEEINEAVDEAIRRYSFVDPARLAAGGASYGGHLANWLQATTTRYRCLISHAGLVNLEAQWGTSDVIYSRELNNGGPVWDQGPIWREQNPARLAGNAAKKTGWMTPMMLTVGELDYRVPVNNTIEAWSLHQRLQIPSKLVVFPDENHWILKGGNSRFWYGEVHAWWKRWLK